MVAKLAILKNKGINFDENDNDILLVTTSKLSTFFCVFCLILLGSYISYNKSTVKVDVMQKILKFSSILLIVFFAFIAIHIAFIIAFAYIDMNEETKKVPVILMSTSLSIIFYAIESLLLIVS